MNNNKELKIHFLNTIWSDAIILESNNHFAFVDTGSKFYYPMIKDHLTKYNINHLDFILLTHFHTDHYGNIENIINDFKVDKLYLKHYHGLDGTTSSGYSSNEEYIQNEFNNYYNILNSAHKNNVEIIYLDDFSSNTFDLLFDNITLELYDTSNILYKLYSDTSSKYYQEKLFNENFDSICIYINVNDHHIFLGGDMTCSNTEVDELKKRSINVVNEIYKKHNISQIDIYKSCHHGGGGTNTLELCELLKAKYAIITNTARWLDTYDTYNNLKSGNTNVEILPTDYQKYIFTIDRNITYEKILEDSLFITLKKN